jgi:hypothetical protein
MLQLNSAPSRSYSSATRARRPPDGGTAIFRDAGYIASALVVGAASEQQIVADDSSMQVRIPAEFWAELKKRKLIEQDAPVPA